MKVIFIYCLIILTCLINQINVSSNFKNDRYAKECFKALKNEESNENAIGLVILHLHVYDKDFDYLREMVYEELNSIVDSRMSSNYFCQSVIDPCKDNLKSYISNYNDIYSSVLDFDFSKIQKNLDSLYDDVENMIKNKCDLESDDSSYKQDLRFLENKKSKLSNFISPIFKLNENSQICKEKIHDLYFSDYNLSFFFDYGYIKEAGESIQKMKKIVSDIKLNCSIDFYFDCKEKYENTKKLKNEFSNYLLANSYVLARDMISSLTDSIVAAVACGIFHN